MSVNISKEKSMLHEKRAQASFGCVVPDNKFKINAGAV